MSKKKEEKLATALPEILNQLWAINVRLEKISNHSNGNFYYALNDAIYKCAAEADNAKRNGL